MPGKFDAVWACAFLLLKNQVLHITMQDKTVTAAGQELLVKTSRGTALYRGDAYELAARLVDEVGTEGVLRSARVRTRLPKRGRVEWI